MSELEELDEPDATVGCGWAAIVVLFGLALMICALLLLDYLLTFLW